GFRGGKISIGRAILPLLLPTEGEFSRGIGLSENDLPDGRAPFLARIKGVDQHWHIPDPILRLDAPPGVQNHNGPPVQRRGAVDERSLHPGELIRSVSPL